MLLLDRVIYQTQVKTTAGRDTRAVSSDGVLDLKVSRPRELGGTNRRGTHPERLFAASYAACFLGMMRLVAMREAIALPADTRGEGRGGIGPRPPGVWS